MNLIDFKDYCIIKMQRLSNLNKLIDTLNTSSMQKKHVIIDFLSTEMEDDIIVNNLLQFHFIWQKRNKSFILVSNMGKKSLKDLISLKTLEEALDFFQMEQLTRII